MIAAETPGKRCTLGRRLGQPWQTGRVLRVLVERRWLLLTLLMIALTVHLYGLYVPGEPNASFAFPHADKVLHVLGFFIPALLWLVLVRRWWPLGVLAANAVASELVQQFWLPNRDGDVFDLVADLAGLVAAGLVYRWFSASIADSTPTSSTSAASRRPQM